MLISAIRNSKKYWKELRKVFPADKDNNSTASQITLKDSAGQVVSDRDTTDLFSKFFTEIGPNLATQIKEDNSRYLYTQF